jgi:quercetin dioxygenase-like cupin family protein
MANGPDEPGARGAPGHPLRVIAPGSGCLDKAGGAATNNAFAVLEQRLPAGFSPPPHVHHNEDEALYLLSGQLIAQVGDQQVEASAGAFLWLPRDVQHGFTVSNDGPCSLLVHSQSLGLRPLRG